MFLVQRGKLSGNYKTCYKTVSRAAAWRAYFKTKIAAGEKKRIQFIGQGKPQTLKVNREYWT